MPKLKRRGSSGPRPKDKSQRNSNSMGNRIATSVPRDFDSDEESINDPSDYFPRGRSENVPLPSITSQSLAPASIPAVIKSVPNRQQRHTNRRRVISNQEIRERLKSTGLCTQLTDSQLSTILVPEEGHEDDIEIGDQEPMPQAVPGHLNPVPLSHGCQRKPISEHHRLEIV